jgi:hypothetical protein
MKEMSYRTEVHKREEQHRNYGCCCLHTKTPRNDWRAANSCLELARMCNENCADILNSYKMCLIKRCNKFIWLILSFIFPCAHLETAIVPLRLGVELMFTSHFLPSRINHDIWQTGCETPRTVTQLLTKVEADKGKVVLAPNLAPRHKEVRRNEDTAKWILKSEH